MCGAGNQTLARERGAVLEESCQWTGPAFFLDLRGTGAGVMPKEGSAPKVAGPILRLMLKNTPNVSIAFFLLHFLYFEPQVYFEGHAASGL